MPKRFVTIVDITSSKINVLTGTHGVNNTFLICGKGESEYSGFMDGDFLEPDKLELALGMALSNAEASSGKKIDSIFVGVPADFSFVKCVEVEETFKRKIFIGNKNIEDLNSRAIKDNLLQDKTIISCSPIWYILDDSRKIFNNPYGMKAGKIKAKLSLIYVENKFIKIFNAILGRLNIKTVEYISTPLAESQYLLSRFDRERKAIIIDSDYISTSVIEVYGKGLMALNSFPIGGGHITADLAETFNLSFSSAESLKNDIILSLNSRRVDNYEVSTEDEIVRVPISVANDTVLNRINMIGTLINKCLKQNQEENLEINSVYLTGSGLSYINGSREYLSKRLGKDVIILVPSMPSMAKPHFSSSLSVLYVALNEKNKPNWINWIKNLFKF